MAVLAINGGKKVRDKPFPAYNTIDKAEEEAVLRVLRSGKLSTYLGTWHDDFYGGVEVQSFEREWESFFGVKHAISVNSATSGLYASVGALGLGVGDEVIVSSYTMSASATAALVYGATPVFADIDEDSFTLDVKSIESKITPKTKAIIVVDIFGGVYDVESLDTLAKKYNLKIIEDCAQAPGVKYKNRYLGTFGDIGVFSLNYHKHIHSGEGGVVVTDDDSLAHKLRLIRNHAEAVINAKGYESVDELKNMVGFNYRMTEIECAIAKEQLKKLPQLIKERIKNVDYLEAHLKEIPFLSMPKRMGEHAFYVHPIRFDESKAGVSRESFVKALKAELPRTLLRDESDVLISYGYVKPLYLQPLYQEKIAFSFNDLSDQDYSLGICPVTEKMHFKELITHELMRPGMSQDNLDDVIEAFIKVSKNLDELR